jgi:DNA-binding ferritin-like protein (Dps family)
MISEFYLKKALNIRKEYLSIVSNINLFENMAKDILKIIEGKLEELNTLQSKINEKRISNVESAKDSLLKIILDLEEESNNIEKSVNDLTSRIDKLKINEKELFADLRKNYQNLTNEEIRNQIHKYIDKKLSIKPNKKT